MKGCKSLRWGFLMLSFATALASGGRTENPAEWNRSAVQAVETSHAQEKTAVPGFRLLHSFAGGPDDGAHPYGSLILSGTTFYGMTNSGGKNDLGTIFKIQMNGTGYTLLHSFAGGSNDGKYPRGDLIISGSTLYGVTEGDAYNDYGTVFKIQTDGSGFTLLHSFAGGAADGARPVGSLSFSGSTLYGMTAGGGTAGAGLIFKLQMDGTGFTIVHEFARIYNHEGHPVGSLVISGSILYGRLDTGGVFKIQTDGSDYSNFGFCGYIPIGSLILSGSSLYGMDHSESQYYRNGSINKIRTDGSGFTRLYTIDYEWPCGTPFISGSTLYGFTSGNYAGSYGSVFKVKTDGTGFVPFYKFSRHANNGGSPVGSPIISGSSLYGMMGSGGAKGEGVIYSLPIGNDIISPNGGEKWIAGDTHEVTWNTNDIQDKINIDYSINNGGSWSRVASKTSNDGSFSWTVPNMPSTTCLVRIKNVDTSISDVSDAVFSILMNLDLVVERHEVRAFSILRQYGLIHFLGGNPNIPVAEYRIMRRKGNEEFTLLRTVAPSELQDNQFQMQDKYLGKGISYTYRVEAVDAAGQLIGISSEKTI